MNYKAELRGFALDRATEVAKFGDKDKSIKEIMADADELVDYLYIPDKDLESHIQSISKLIQESGNVEIVKKLLLELQQIEAEIEAGIKRAS
jgi:hypothetical protein